MSRFKAGDVVIITGTDTVYDGKSALIIGTPWRRSGSFMHTVRIGEEMSDVTEDCLTPLNDNIHPDHYKTGGLEPIEYMRMKMTPEAFEGFCIGNVIKYVSRYKDKNGLEDLKKAQKYLRLAVEAYGE